MDLELLDQPSPPMNRIVIDSKNPELRRLVVHQTLDEIVIRGRVSSYYVKQMAQEQLRAIADGRRIVNLAVVES